MARIWKKPYTEAKDGRLPDFLRCQPARKPFEWVYFVHVCSFTFAFDSVEQIAEYLEYYSHKSEPSSRAPEHGEWPERLTVGSHWERQTLFDELPLYLYSKPKREKVVKALKWALREISE